MGKNEKRFFSSVLMLSLISGTCFAQHPRVTQLIAEKQAKMKKLEDCQGTTKKLKIAGISTLGITAVGVAGNIAEAVILKDAKSKLADSQNAYNEQDTIRKEREACIQKDDYKWVGGKCEKAQKAPAEETPAKETPAKETPAEEAPAEEAPAEEAPAEEAPAEETPAEKVPTEEAPAEETPAEKVPTEEAPAEEANVVQQSSIVSGSAIQLPDWFKTACGNLSVEIKGTKCEKVDEPKTPQEYINQVAALESEKLSWENPNTDYKFGLCTIDDNKYTCTFTDTSINTTYILSREVSAKNVKCKNAAQTFDTQTKQCILKDSNPQNQQQTKLNLKPVNMRTGGANRQTQQEYCKKIGQSSGNGCIYTGATIEIENNFQESVTQILSDANLKYKGITPSSTSEYVVKAVAPDNKTFLNIRIDQNTVKCKDATKTLTSDTYQCVGTDEDKNALQRAQPKNLVSKEDLILLCSDMRGTVGDGNADTNTCRLLAKDAGHMQQLKKHIEEHSDAQCNSYTDNEAVICNDQKGKSVTITIKK